MQPAADELRRLQQELAASREHVQAVIEEQEAINEELQSANEEVQSANEELQSINEELETSKEEIQSSNEELATVNDELQNRNLELAQANNDLTNLLGSVNMAIVMLGMDLRIRRFTNTAEKILNLIPSDIGRPITDLKLPFEVGDLHAQIGEVIDSVTMREIETQDRDGRWYSLRIRPYRTTENRIEGAVLVLVDIQGLKLAEQELRDSEARFKLLADVAPVMIWVNGVDGCQFVNRAYLEFLGVTAREVLGYDWARYVHLDDREAYLGAYTNALANRASFTGQFRFRRADGVYRWMKSAALPRTALDGEFLGLVGCTFDITDVKEAERTLHEAADRKNEFLAMLSHELRNPLAGMRNSVRILRSDGIAPDVVRHALEVLDRQSGNMVRMIDDLLDIARITRGKLELRRETVDLVTVVRNAVEATVPARDGRQVKVDCTLPQTALWVDADPVRLDQILVNLLHNAVKFSRGDGCIRVTATAEERAGDRPRAVVRVHDQGIGIEPAEMSLIFEPFVAGSRRSRSGQGAGMGLGLAVVKRLVELHGGSIEATSRGEGQGSEFVIRLPLVAPDPASRRPAAVERARRTQRVLVVDDDADHGSTLRTVLEGAGHSVTVVGSGEEALAAMGKVLPDVALVDLAMPGMSGYELARAVRSDARLGGVHLVAVTGHGGDADRVRCLDAGFDRHLVKPVEPEGLFGIMEELASHPAS